MRIVIIFNPNSTGDGKANAQKLARQLRDEGLDVTVRKTTHAGHGEEIATRYAKSGEEVVLISSSGDGGYHEVVNGALRLLSKGLVVGVLPSGNANDHYTALHTGSLAAAIQKKKFRRIDTIKITATIDGKPWVRYAHSYVGIGVTASAAKRLTINRPNIVTEKWIVARSLLGFRYVKIIEDAKVRRYSSIVLSNIAVMSKVMKMSETASVTDGKFEMSRIRFHSKLRLIAYLLSAATVGVKESPSLKEYSFKTTKPLLIQLDGEVYTIDARSDVLIASAKRSLHCVL